MRILMILAIICLMAVPMVIGASTMTLNQGVSIQVNEAIVVDITPDNLDFGQVTPSATASAGPDIKFDATGSNIDLTLSSSVEGSDVLFQGISFIDQINPSDIKSITSFSTALPMSSQIKTFGTQILVPFGTLAGTKAGTIIYTITGPSP